MVQFKLVLEATLENVESITTPEDMRWHIKWSCNNCNEQTEKFIYITATEQVQNPKGRGSSNLLYTCKFCKRECSVDIVPGSQRPYTESESKTAVVTFDCRGLSPEEFKPEGKLWIAQSEDSKTKYQGIDLSGDWADFDDAANHSVGIYDVSGSFERV